jgi:hypothetical protein
MMEEKKCWICRRTEEQLKKDNIFTNKDFKFIEIESVSWKKLPYICEVCHEIIFCMSVTLTSELTEDMVDKDDLSDIFERVAKSIQEE